MAGVESIYESGRLPLHQTPNGYFVFDEYRLTRDPSSEEAVLATDGIERALRAVQVSEKILGHFLTSIGASSEPLLPDQLVINPTFPTDPRWKKTNEIPGEGAGGRVHTFFEEFPRPKLMVTVNPFFPTNPDALGDMFISDEVRAKTVQERTTIQNLALLKLGIHEGLHVRQRKYSHGVLSDFIAFDGVTMVAVEKIMAQSVQNYRELSAVDIMAGMMRIPGTQDMSQEQIREIVSPIIFEAMERDLMTIAQITPRLSPDPVQNDLDLLNLGFGRGEILLPDGRVVPVPASSTYLSGLYIVDQLTAQGKPIEKLVLEDPEEIYDQALSNIKDLSILGPNARAALEVMRDNPGQGTILPVRMRENRRFPATPADEAYNAKRVMDAQGWYPYNPNY